MLIHLLDPLDTDRHSSHLDKKMLPYIVKQSNEYLYRIMPFWRRYCLCVWMAWGALRTQENGTLRALNFNFLRGSMPPNPPSLVGANHSCKILDPPLLRQQINKLAFVNKDGAKFTKPKLVLTSIPLPWNISHVHNLPRMFDSLTNCALMSLVAIPTDRSFVEATSNKHS